MKTQVRNVSSLDGPYTALAFVCPGCRELTHGSGLHMLPVNRPNAKNGWNWNKDTEFPTLSPSILTKTHFGTCHSFLEDGVFRFLEDCTHSMAGQSVPMVDLPEWFTERG